MASRQRCCCGSGDDCCTVCAENCKVAEIAAGMGQVRVRVFALLDFEEQSVTTNECGSLTREVSYSVDETADTTIDAPSSGEPCTFFAVDDAFTFSRPGSVSGTGCLADSDDLTEDWVAALTGALRTDGSAAVRVHIYSADEGPFGANADGGFEVDVEWRREPSATPGCDPFEVARCIGYNFNAAGGFVFTDPEVGGMTMTGLDSACHGDITITINKSGTRTIDHGDGSVTQHTASISGTIRLLVEGLEVCDSETPMPDLPGSCDFPAPDPEPTDCCEVDGSPCKPTSTDAFPAITIDRVFARVQWSRAWSISCDTGDPLNPDQESGSAGWLGNINLTSLTLLPDEVVNGCPVYRGHYSVTNDITGTQPLGCSGGVAFVGPATGSMTMTVDFTYLPGARRCWMVVDLRDAAADALSVPRLRVLVDLDPANSPVTDDSYAYSRQGGATIGVHEYEIPTDWDIDSYEATCHSGFTFSGNAGPPVWYDPRQKGANSVSNEETFIWQGELDLSGLEACA